MKKYGVVGHTGKVGSLLIQRANFVPIKCDVTNIDSLWCLDLSDLDVIVNCVAISSIDECEKDYEKAINVNVNGLTNLHRVFGSRVLNLSSDQVYSGKGWFPPAENKNPYPINGYGMTKFASEGVSDVFGGKTIRLSRSVSIYDQDISTYLGHLKNNTPTFVPEFFYRNYIHREFAADGIEFMVNNWDRMPKLVNYCGTENWNMYLFMVSLADALGFDSKLVKARKTYSHDLAPRPKRCGLNIGLARKLGFPRYSLANSISKLVQEYQND